MLARDFFDRRTLSEHFSNAPIAEEALRRLEAVGLYQGV